MRAAAVLAASLAFAVMAAPGTARALEPPPPSRGFQLAIRSGVALPMGNVSSTTAMSDALSPQLPFLLDLGWKLNHNIFIGAYGGVGVGGAAGQVAQACADLRVNCVGLGFRFGLMAQYHVRPNELVNPWIGYGIGYEIGGSSGSSSASGTNTISNSVRGFELGHVLGGVDFRFQDLFGAGPFLDAAIGRYDVAESRTNAGGRVSQLGGAIDQPALHVWLILGVRAVLYP